MSEPPRDPRQWRIDAPDEPTNVERAIPAEAPPPQRPYHPPSRRRSSPWTVLGWMVVGVLLVAIGVGSFHIWQATRDKRDYPTAARDAFLMSCAASSHGNATDDLCHCALDKIEDEYSFSEFTQLGKVVLETGETSPVMVTAITKCGGTIDPLESSSSTSGPTAPSAVGTDPPAATTDTGLELGVDDTTEPNAAAGEWRTVSGEPCSWTMYDASNRQLDAGESSVVQMPLGVRNFVHYIFCDWTYVG